MLLFNQKTGYEMRISDWSSDVCSADLDLLAEQRDGEGGAEQRRGDGDRRRLGERDEGQRGEVAGGRAELEQRAGDLDLGVARDAIGRATCRDRVRQSEWCLVVAVLLQNKETY